MKAKCVKCENNVCRLCFDKTMSTCYRCNHNTIINYKYIKPVTRTHIQILLDELKIRDNKIYGIMLENHTKLCINIINEIIDFT